ncbi:zinc ribbon domain-containing protein [Candidatus Bathyarchaeota archaeon]|nr:MAG: zinc ribbon domain-containing protein [Candidatus Bathyarchaeota archaeon]
MNYCLSPFCVSGPVGSESVSGIPGLGVVWGFQSGFYTFLVAVLILVAGLLFNSRLSGNLVPTGAMRTHLSTGNVAASCPKCGSNLQSQSKFCPNCGEAQSRT